MSSGIVTNDGTLDQLVTDPRHRVPGNEMPFDSIKDAGTHADLLTSDKQTVTLNVANATCELCGSIVKGSLSKVSGVLDVQISEADGAAIAKVRFEDSRTNVPALITATTNAGYPSRIVQ